MTVLVAGAGGFIGGHLVNRLVKEGYSVRAADRKALGDWYQVNHDADNIARVDLSREATADAVIAGMVEVFMLAADMGGMGFIEQNKLDCMMSVLTSTQTLDAARIHDVRRFFFSSSACVYAADKQTDTNVTALKEEDAYPAQAEDGYGWEKLFTERMCRHFAQETGLITRVARYHNVYGPYGTYDGGREKAPAALCRKVIEAKLSGNHSINIWGDGEQTRSFMFVDDCVEGTLKIMRSSIDYPINLGSSRLISINDMLTIIENIAGVHLTRSYDLSAPQGVRGRNSDNTRIQQELDWEPDITLEAGLEATYRWIYDQMTR